jgi:biotin/methionine sulfoxide reductase
MGATEPPKTTLTPMATHWGNYDVETRDGRVVAVHPVAGDQDASPIGPGIPEALYAPARVLQPMIRRGWLEGARRKGGNRRGAEPFVAVTWDRALDLVADELDRVRTRHGNEAIYGGSYGWASAGRFHHAQRHLHRLLNLAGGYTRSVNTYSTAALEVILPHVLGVDLMHMAYVMPTWAEIAEHGELVVAFGGLAPKNSQVNYGGVGRHTASAWQRRCKEAGVEFVSIGPVKADAADFLEAQWLTPRPNTDVALMLGLAHTLVAEDLHDRDFLERCCVGFDRFAEYLRDKDAEWAAQITGLDAETIRRLARRIGTKRTTIAVSWSVQRQDHGEQSYWAAVVLAAMSGSMGRPGGGFGGGFGAIHSNGLSRHVHWVASVEQGPNPVTRFIPVARISDMLLNPGETIDYNGQRVTYPDIRLVWWAGGNPFHHHQDLNRLVRAWQEPETVIVQDAWWTPAARFADVVLPATTVFERDDLASGVRDAWVSAMRRATDPPGEARDDFEILRGIAARLGLEESFTGGRSADEGLRHLYEQTRACTLGLPEFEEFWRRGRIELPSPPEPPCALDALRADPDAHPLQTPSGKIEIFSATIDSFAYDDCPGHPAWFEPAEWLGSPLAARFPLHLVSNQPSTRLHSQFDLGGYSRASKIQDREPMWINPADAAARGIADGDVVRLYNDRGACLAGAVVTDRIQPGAVQLATGAWYDPAEPGVPGSLDRHGNPNVLTLDKGTSKLAQGPIAHTTLVEVERFDGEPPPVGAFVPPPVMEIPTGEDTNRRGDPDRS